MHTRHTLEQNRQKSVQIWAQAQRNALHEAVKNTPVNPPAVAAGLGTGSGGSFSGNTFENEYVANDYLPLDYVY